MANSDAQNSLNRLLADFSPGSDWSRFASEIDCELEVSSKCYYQERVTSNWLFEADRFSDRWGLPCGSASSRGTKARCPHCHGQARGSGGSVLHERKCEVCGNCFAPNSNEDENRI